jgi:hypothetical protein
MSSCEASGMARKKMYDESKRRFTMTLTESAIEWLEKKRIELKAGSLSDVIEKMAREESELNKSE